MRGVDMRGLIAENAALNQENAELRSAMTRAEERIRSLEERLARNSYDSSKPPCPTPFDPVRENGAGTGLPSPRSVHPSPHRRLVLRPKETRT